MKRENNNLRHRFCSSYSHTGAVRLEIRGNKLFFLKKSQPLWGRILVGASLDGFGKQTVSIIHSLAFRKPYLEFAGSDYAELFTKPINR